MLPISLCDVTLYEDPYILPHLSIRKKNEFLLSGLFVFVSRYYESQVIKFSSFIGSWKVRAQFSLLFSVYNYEVIFERTFSCYAIFYVLSFSNLFVMFSLLHFKFHFIVLLNISVETDLITLENTLNKIHKCISQTSYLPL